MRLAPLRCARRLGRSATRSAGADRDGRGRRARRDPHARRDPAAPAARLLPRDRAAGARPARRSPGCSPRSASASGRSLRQATFSLWRSLDDARRYAYGAAAHAEVVRRTRAERLVLARSCSRASRPTAPRGTWDGRDPLALTLRPTRRATVRPPSATSGRPPPGCTVPPTSHSPRRRGRALPGARASCRAGRAARGRRSRRPARPSRARGRRACARTARRAGRARRGDRRSARRRRPSRRRAERGRVDEHEPASPSGRRVSRVRDARTLT